MAIGLYAPDGSYRVTVTGTESGGSAITVGGANADDAAASGNPVPVGGIYTTSRPTYTTGDRTQFQFDSRGNLFVTLATVDTTSGPPGTNPGDAKAAVNGLGIWSQNGQYNGSTWDREYNNRDITVFSSAARTATPTPADITNYNGKGVHVVIDVTSVTSTPSVTFTIEGKDALSGKYYTILASAAIATTQTLVLKVHPSLTAAANTVANDFIPRTFRVTATHGNADSITYSVGLSLVG